MNYTNKSKVDFVINSITSSLIQIFILSDHIITHNFLCISALSHEKSVQV